MGDVLHSLLRAIQASQAPSGVSTRFVAIDGAGGAGKTSLAEWLARRLGAPIIHTDDFASWNNPVNWWPELIERALEPLAAGQPARYQPTKWGDEETGPIVIQPGGTVVVEGVTASRRAFRPYLAYSIWVEADRDVRLQRGIDRDGEEARAQWEQWMAEEDHYIATEHPADHADAVLRGDKHLWL
jgi:uridine kinase